MSTATRETVAFVLDHARRGQRLLEVGCGDGAVAAALVEQGLEVTALDHSEAAVDAARERGVDAQHADFLDFDGQDFDIILFTRSLHHIHPLPGAVARAAAMLASGGRVVVEDFAVEAADAATAAWFYGLGEVLAAAGLHQDDAPEAGQPLARWRHDHDGHHHPIATRAAMGEALGAALDRAAEATASYLYRYFEGAGDPVRDAIWRWESDAIERGLIRAVGWRSVWTLRG